MTRRKLISVVWSPSLKQILACILLIAFLIGMGIGYLIGTVSTETASPTTTQTTNTPILTEPPTAMEIATADIPAPNIEPLDVYYDCPMTEDLQDYVRNLCESNDLPMSLVIAIIDVESSFEARAISKTGDYGLMQINTVNHEWLSKEYGITDFLDPYQNVFCGITIIAGHLEKTDGNIALALMRYNCGATGAKRLWDKGIYSTSYTEKILAAMEVYGNEI